MPLISVRNIVTFILSGLCFLLLSACQGETKKATVTTESLGAPLTATTPNPSPSVDPRVTDLNRIVPGKEAPDFALENINNQVVRLSDFRGKKNVILVFYRGHF